jgi:hypothetical protein
MKAGIDASFCRNVIKLVVTRWHDVRRETQRILILEHRWQVSVGKRNALFVGPFADVCSSFEGSLLLSLPFRCCRFAMAMWRNSRKFWWVPEGTIWEIQVTFVHGAEHYSIVSQRFMEPEGSLPHSQEPSTYPYPEPVRTTPSHLCKIQPPTSWSS